MHSGGSAIPELPSRQRQIQGLFKDLHRNLRTFQGIMEFKDFLRTSPKIQGLSRLWEPCKYKRKEGRTNLE